jgi:hypothetical protein
MYIQPDIVVRSRNHFSLVCVCACAGGWVCVRGCGCVRAWVVCGGAQLSSMQSARVVLSSVVRLHVPYFSTFT